MAGFGRINLSASPIVQAMNAPPLGGSSYVPGTSISSYTPSLAGSAKSAWLTAISPGNELRHSSYADFSNGRYGRAALKYGGSIALRVGATLQLPFELAVSGVRGNGFNPTSIDREDAAVISFALGGLSGLRSPGIAAETEVLTGVRANQLAGSGREALARAELEALHPGASIQNEVYLRGANGKRAIDPLTGEARRIDSVVIQDGRVLDSVEVTSQTANKTAQIRKEIRIRNNGGTFIRDRATGQLIDISGVPTRVVRKQ